MAQTVPKPMPSFAELEAAGARIGEIRVVTDNIFDTSDPHEDNLLYRAANAIHTPPPPGSERDPQPHAPGRDPQRVAVQAGRPGVAARHRRDRAPGAPDHHGL